jgi:lactoylglutathione lyase
MIHGAFTYTIVYVPDVERTLAFYETAFGLQRRFIADDGTYGELQTGDVTLSFAAESLAEKNLGIKFIRHRPDSQLLPYEVAFATEDVDGLVLQAVESGATIVTAPIEKPWGQTVAYVRDPNGVLIEICTPIAS